MRPYPILAGWLIVAGALPLTGQGPRGYYRDPALHDRTLVFVAEGDLWTVDVTGVRATRLTTHPGEERHPAISPDGTGLAFSASYEGPTEVYLMPLAGGLPTRVTWDGGAARVVGWTPDGEILYATRHFSTLPNTQLVAVNPATGRRRLIPLAQAAEGTIAPETGTLFFTRLARQRSNAKRYQGGTAQNLWRFTPGDAEARPLTADYPGTSRTPMWWNGRVYFTSDRDGTMNLWSMDPSGGTLRQLTDSTGWDVQSSSLSAGRIAYRVGADIYLYDIATDQSARVDITLPSDFDQLREHWIADPFQYLSAAHLGPRGHRVVLTTRGQVFVAPVRHGRLTRVTLGATAGYGAARFLPGSPDLLATSDASGETEFVRLHPADPGRTEPMTTGATVTRIDGIPSPDGHWLAHWDRDQILWMTDTRDGTTRQIDFSPQWGYDAPRWSPDSRWIVYGKPASNDFVQLFVFNVETGTHRPITSDRFNSLRPAWSPDGRWIYFLSDRNFETLVGSPWGTRQPEPFFDRPMRVYALGLVPHRRSPFAPLDELHEASDESDAADTTGPVEIVFDGLPRRLHRVPVPPGNYRGLMANRERLFWLDRETGVSGTTSLRYVAITHDRPMPKVLVSRVQSAELSADGQRLLVRTDKTLAVIDAGAQGPVDLKEHTVDLSDWTFAIDPREEWPHLFLEAWRLHRDWFYDRNMHGVDWEAMRDKYLPLVDRVRTRDDLNDLEAMLVSELSALHSSVGGGDRRRGVDQVAPASLGARLIRDEEAGGYRIAHIYRTDPDLPGERSPLDRPDADVRDGDILEAINGVPVLDRPPGALLRHQAGQPVRLRVRTPGARQARDLIVTAISPSRAVDLRYDEWEFTRRLRVDSMGGGRIGYVHLRAMSRNNVAEWYREFYPVFTRQGLIIDVRHNRGGNIDSWILEKLIRKAWMYWQPRVGAPYWNMQKAFRGHLVVLADERTASDGEAFAEGFKRLGLGPVIGTRTWGGEIWLTSSNRVLDQGIARAAEFGVYGPDGRWLIEGWGVVPDRVVDNLPHATFSGRDAQLEAAVAYLEQRIREDPRPVPLAPAYPDKSVPGNARTTSSSGRSRP